MSVTKGMSHDPVLHHPGEVEGPFHRASANINPMDLVLCGLFPPHLMGTVCNCQRDKRTKRLSLEPVGWWYFWCLFCFSVSLLSLSSSTCLFPISLYLIFTDKRKSELMPLAYGLACTFSQRLVSNNFNNWSDLTSQRPGRCVLW